MKTIDTLHELLKHELKDLYSAETQIIEALPAMVEKASSKELKKALQDHLRITEKQKERLDKVQQMLGEEDKKEQKDSKGFFANLFKSNEGEEHCKAMEGLVKEGKKLLGEDMTPQVMDAGIIAACQKIEHYEISSYGTARAYALQLKMDTVGGMLEETLNEEYYADDALTALALSDVNHRAEAPGGNGKTAKGSTAKIKDAKKGNKTKPAAKKAAPKKAVSKKAADKKPAGKAKKTASKKATSR